MQKNTKKTDVDLEAFVPVFYCVQGFIYVFSVLPELIFVSMFSYFTCICKSICLFLFV